MSKMNSDQELRVPEKTSDLEQEEEEENDDGGGGQDDEDVSPDGWEDILGSGRLRKRVVRVGDADGGGGGGGRPSRGDGAVVSWKGFFQEAEFERRDKDEFVVGESEVIQAVDLVVALMQPGEVCEVISDPEFAYGKAGLEPHVPPMAAVRLELELVSHSPSVPVGELSIEERSRIGRRKKDRGGFWFDRQEYTHAVQCYRKAGEYFEDEKLALEVPLDRYSLPQELQGLLEDRVKTFNNLAMSQMKLGASDSALASLQQVLKLEPNNEKALYRKAKVLVEKYRFEEALGILRRVNRLYPHNKSCQTDLNQLAFKLRKSRAKEEQMSRKMLGLDKYEADKKAAEQSSWGRWWPRSSGWLQASCLVGLTSVVLAGASYAVFSGQLPEARNI